MSHLHLITCGSGGLPKISGPAIPGQVTTWLAAAGTSLETHPVLLDAIGGRRNRAVLSRLSGWVAATTCNGDCAGVCGAMTSLASAHHQSSTNRRN